MEHARKDYDRIQDPENLIPEDEPVFLIRGQDKCGPSAVRCWAMLAEQAGADPAIVHAALCQADEMDAWQGPAGKIPDMPLGKAAH